ncbi:MAG: adenosylcobinamide-GDP ribazoletransferase [Duncaniella sp.]|nr:adenosylcobinamide-GDP ribazoletransferase [Duncaniella sp.]
MKKFAAALILFTRLPIWKWVNPSQADYSDAVVYWPLTGWITGGLTALAMYCFSFAMPWPTAVILALVGRLLLTGALHEDGLADFCDAFGCGGDKNRILSIMKDSHIGTYGVIGLICYIALWVSLFASFDPVVAVCAVFAADPFAKLCAGQITNILPYARPEGAKNKISYSRMRWYQLVFQMICGVLPMFFMLMLNPWLALSTVCPIAMCMMLSLLMAKKIGGYTGDCCGATCLLCELSMILGIGAILHCGL